jgi:hypothetical protein
MIGSQKDDVEQNKTNTKKYWKDAKAISRVRCQDISDSYGEVTDYKAANDVLYLVMDIKMCPLQIFHFQILLL